MTCHLFICIISRLLRFLVISRRFMLSSLHIILRLVIVLVDLRRFSI